MRTVIQTGYGSADVMALKEIAQPTPGAGQVLVRVRAASLAAGDYFSMRGTPFPIRLMIGLFRPKPDYVVGLDCAGIVEAVGPNVSRFQPGDAVYGECRGACAEYALAREGNLAPMPANLSFEHAAAVPTSACTALQGLRDHGKLRPGHKVLINGASGGVGLFAVQIARAFGAEVTGVCSTRNVDLVRSIGADHVIDYTNEDFTQNGRRYDLILDNVANHSFTALRRALTPQGMVIPNSGHGGMGYVFKALLLAPFVRQVGSMYVATANSKDLALLKDLIEAGNVTAVIDRTYPLRDTPEAFRYLEQGHARGKVVITVTSGSCRYGDRSHTPRR